LNCIGELIQRSADEAITGLREKIVKGDERTIGGKKKRSGTEFGA
jgi:hypothetical protein